MSKFIDLTGKRFGRYTVLYKIENQEFTRSHIYYKCKCDCGITKNIRGTSLSKKEHSTKSCGCLQKDKAREIGKKFRKPYGIAHITNIYVSYRNRAKLKNLEFKLSKEKLTEFIMKNCEYCGSKPSSSKKIKSTKENFLYNGIDRINPKLGYVEGNITTCCSQCNYAKLDYSYIEFYNWIVRCYNHLLNKSVEGNFLNE